jgi:hypothetical protein
MVERYKEDIEAFKKALPDHFGLTDASDLMAYAEAIYVAFIRPIHERLDAIEKRLESWDGKRPSHG